MKKNEIINTGGGNAIKNNLGKAMVSLFKKKRDSVHIDRTNSTINALSMLNNPNIGRRRLNIGKIQNG